MMTSTLYNQHPSRPFQHYPFPTNNPASYRQRQLSSMEVEREMEYLDGISAGMAIPEDEDFLDLAFDGPSDLDLDPESEEFAEYAAQAPVEAIEFLRDFVAESGNYVEELETALCERSDDYWESREHAYRLITGLLLGAYRAQSIVQAPAA